jgi:hypothetical protein
MTHLGCQASTYHLKRTSQTTIENPLKDIPVIAKGEPIVRIENLTSCHPLPSFHSFHHLLGYAHEEALNVFVW